MNTKVNVPVAPALALNTDATEELEYDVTSAPSGP